MVIKLDGGWKLKGWWPYEWVMGSSMENNDSFDGITPWIDASVPGSIHNDLLNAGLIENPYYGLNSVKCEWVSQRAWMYSTKFILAQDLKDRSVKLVFHGVDYASNYYLNGCFLGRHEGMFTPVCFNINGMVRFGEVNELIVVIEKAPDEMDQIGYTSKTKTQKARFGYKWDFGTRLVDLGIWKNAEIRVTGCCTIEDIYLEPSLSEDLSESKVSYRIDAYSTLESDLEFRIAFIKNGNMILESSRMLAVPKGETTIEGNMVIHHPELWHPAGFGAQNLYSALIEVYDPARNLSDTKEVTFGIRKLQFVQNHAAPEGSLPYTIQVNGKNVFIKGWNLVPIDHMYGFPGTDKYKWLIGLAIKANVNLLRVWGGGLVEREEFYKLCDEAGIMVWQEFIQSSSGIDNEASVERDFLVMLRETAESIIKQKRNHASLVIWCGGNELMDSKCKPHGYDHPNISLLKGLVDELSPMQLFLPTSASGPVQWLDADNTGKGLHHDIHGQWRYLGAEKHYSYYNANDCLIHTEFGVQGCASAVTIRSMMPEDGVFPINRHNALWKHHGAAWWHTEDDVEMLFGEAGDLESFAKRSQFIQAEGLRYIVESNMRRMPACSGVIPWQMNEPWPNAVCTNAIEHGGNPKMAYYWVKNAYEPFHVSLKYDKIRHLIGETFTGRVFIHNAFDSDVRVEFVCRIENIHGEPLLCVKSTETIQASSCKEVMGMAWDVAEQPKGVFVVYLEGYMDGIRVCRNEYLFSTRDDGLFSQLNVHNQVKLQITGWEKKDGQIWLLVRNDGEETALFTGIQAGTQGLVMYCGNNYCSIRPGQTELFRIEIAPCSGDDEWRLVVDALNVITGEQRLWTNRDIQKGDAALAE